MDEWEKMKDPEYQAADIQATQEAPPSVATDITANEREFTAAIRQRPLGFVRGLAYGDVAGSYAALTPDSDEETAPPSDEEVQSLESLIEEYFQTHERIRLDPEARNQRFSIVQKKDAPREWKLQQTVVDPEDKNDWFVEFAIDLNASKEASAPIMRFIRFYSL